MINNKNIIIIGASAKNAGKTEFACRLIKRESALHSVYAVKCAIIREDISECPHFNNGCGMCTEIDDYLITEEINPPPGKDTDRLLQAGAEKVYMLRAYREHFEKGVEKLFSIIPDDACIVCESNTLREVITPGVFILIKKEHSEKLKPSFRKVAKLADSIITFNGSKWSLPPDSVLYSGDGWKIREPRQRTGKFRKKRKFDATAVIVAGGGSRRMGRLDKPLLPLNGKTLIAHIAEKISPLFKEVIISGSSGKFDFLNLRVIPDMQEGRGPLMGLFSALKESRNEWNYVIACDISEPDTQLIKKLFDMIKDDSELIMPVKPDGRYEPLFAFYRKSVLPYVEKMKTEFLELDKNDRIKNINTYEEYVHNVCAEPAQSTK